MPRTIHSHSVCGPCIFEVGRVSRGSKDQEIHLRHLKRYLSVKHKERNVATWAATVVSDPHIHPHNMNP